MTPFQEPKAPSTPNSLVNELADLKLSLPLPMHLAISATTGPLVGLLVSGRMVAEGLTQLGISSEEIFRGDRLPPLPALANPETVPQEEDRKK